MLLTASAKIANSECLKQRKYFGFRFSFAFFFLTQHKNPQVGVISTGAAAQMPSRASVLIFFLAHKWSFTKASFCMFEIVTTTPHVVLYPRLAK
jgi:hypothetical protein